MDSLNSKFRFGTDKKSIINMILDGNKKLDNMFIVLKAEAGYEKNIDKHDKAFNITEVYNEHKVVAYEDYSKNL